MANTYLQGKSVSNLHQQVISGVSWMTLSQITQQVMQFIISVILARLLMPSDFGLIATITVFTGFATLLGGVGLSNALIQRDKIDDEHISSVFWVNFSTGVFFTLLFIMAAPAIASFYREPLLVNLTRITSLNFILIGLSTTQATIIRRSMNFRLLAIRDMLGLAASGVCGIGLALAGYGVWSLVYRVLLGSLCTLVLLWTASSWRPHFSFHRSAIADLMGFSGNMLGANVLRYFTRNVDNLLVGKYLGSSALGLYARAYTVMLLPLTQVTSVLQMVMFPALSKLQHDRDHAKNIYLRSLSFIALLTFPLMLGLFVVADTFVLALFTAKWADMIPVLRILCLVGLVQSLTSTTRWIYASQGRSDWMLRWELFSTALIILSFVPGILRDSLEILALGYALINVILLYWEFSIPGKLIDLKFGELLQNLRGIFLCAIVMSLVVYSLRFVLPENWPKMLILIVDCLAGCLIYFGLVHIMNLTAYREARGLVINQYKSVFTRLSLKPLKLYVKWFK